MSPLSEPSDGEAVEPPDRPAAVDVRYRYATPTAARTAILVVPSWVAAEAERLGIDMHEQALPMARHMGVP